MLYMDPIWLKRGAFRAFLFPARGICPCCRSRVSAPVGVMLYTQKFGGLGGASCAAALCLIQMLCVLAKGVVAAAPAGYECKWWLPLLVRIGLYRYVIANPARAVLP